MKVRDIMTSDVKTIAMDASVKELSVLLDELNISGVPVVDSDGSVVGVASMSDLGSGVSDPPLAPESGRRFFDEEDSALSGLESAKVADLMTEHVVTVEPTSSVLELATIMEQDGIHRVFVTRGDELVGVVSTMDLVRVLMGMLQKTAAV